MNTGYNTQLNKITSRMYFSVEAGYGFLSLQSEGCIPRGNNLSFVSNLSPKSFSGRTTFSKTAKRQLASIPLRGIGAELAALKERRRFAPSSLVPLI
ncbi:MAG: hypothetical protein LBG15_03565 [Dysgonamonadaceae bacterium]|jgi:hypothetical protein|nr:hypothetical protein [Dysgonamonadaceae bacterium]